VLCIALFTDAATQEALRETRDLLRSQKESAPTTAESGSIFGGGSLGILAGNFTVPPVRSAAEIQTEVKKDWTPLPPVKISYFDTLLKQRATKV